MLHKYGPDGSALCKGFLVQNDTTSILFQALFPQSQITTGMLAASQKEWGQMDCLTGHLGENILQGGFAVQKGEMEIPRKLCCKSGLAAV